jgi:hypothetical protein
MDQQNSTSTQKNQLLDRITGILVNGVSDYQISEQDAKVAARYVLDNEAKLTSDEMMLTFLERISGSWPLFQETYEFYKNNKVAVTKDTAEIEQIKQQLAALANK